MQRYGNSQGSSHNIAWLTTPTLQPVQDNCSVRFFYHMHGAGVGNLTLYSQKLGGDVLDMVELWKRSGAGSGGEDLNMWLRAKVDITTDTEARMIWEASVGQTNMGNIAIDDVSFTPACRQDQFQHIYRIFSQCVPGLTLQRLQHQLNPLPTLPRLPQSQAQPQQGKQQLKSLQPVRAPPLQQTQMWLRQTPPTLTLNLPS